MLVKRKNMLVDNITGELASCDFNPIFDGWTYPDYKKVFNETKQIRFLEAMSAKEFDTEEKLINHIENNLVLAEEKFDGHRALMFITDKGNRFFSKRVSKKSKWLNENSDNVPHLRDFYNLRFNDKRVNPLVGTIIDGEITLPIEDCNSTKVQSVMGALPAKALQYQLDNQFVKLNAFDILYYKGLRVENLPLHKRKLLLLKVIKELNFRYIELAPIFVTSKIYLKLPTIFNEELNDYITLIDDYNIKFREMLVDKKEGLILKDIYGRYEQKRSTGYVKMKAHTTYDVIITGFDDPSFNFDGKTSVDKWRYWYNENACTFWEGLNTKSNNFEEESIPVSKFACLKWIGAIRFGVYKDGKLIEVGKTSGLTDDLRKEISEHKENYMGAVIEVMAQGILDKEKGTLRHPRFFRFRPDKDAEKCTFEDHIRTK